MTYLLWIIKFTMLLLGPLAKNLNVFLIELQPASKNKLIYDVKIINHQVVAFEPPNRREAVSRCYRCQEFGHTRSNCSKTRKCAKCGDLHDAKEDVICPAKGQEQFYCINCAFYLVSGFHQCRPSDSPACSELTATADTQPSSCLTKRCTFSIILNG